jgi:hypothetical protein
MNIKRNSFETKFSGHFYTIAVVFFVSFLFSTPAKTQVLPVGLFETVEEAYRRQMLLAWDSSGVSYMVRPVGVPGKKEGKEVFYLMPVVWKNRIDINHPYAINDGSMISGVGLQTQLSAGFFAKSGHFSIQVRPEFTVAENDDFSQIHEHAYVLMAIRAFMKLILIWLILLICHPGTEKGCIAGWVSGKAT